MEPEAAEAIKIADRHLNGKSPALRCALAKDIVKAVCDHARRLVNEMITKQIRSGLAIVYLREVDGDTDNAAWVVCAKSDPGAIRFTPE